MAMSSQGSHSLFLTYQFLLYIVSSPLLSNNHGIGPSKDHFCQRKVLRSVVEARNLISLITTTSRNHTIGPKILRRFGICHRKVLDIDEFLSLTTPKDHPWDQKKTDYLSRGKSEGEARSTPNIQENA